MCYLEKIEKNLGRFNIELGLYNKLIDNLDILDFLYWLVMLYIYIIYIFLKYVLMWFLRVKGKDYVNNL